MKWTIGLLLVSGLGAAACAAVLVGSLKAEKTIQETEPAAENPDIDVLVARKPLPAMTVVSSEDVTKETVPASEAPPHAVKSAVQVVGKVLIVPLVEGQAFTKDSFASDGSGAHLITALERGKRAMSIVLSDYGALDGLLYPGSVVDVVASFRTPSKENPTEAVSTTVLEGVQVLAVEDKTIVSKEEENEGDEKLMPSSGRKQVSRRKIMVTLLVDSKQSKLLQLATQFGNVSLAIRNPLDATGADRQSASLTDIVGKDQASSGPQNGAQRSGSSFGSAFASSLAEAFGEAVVRGRTERASAASLLQNSKIPTKWEVTLIRGSKSETLLFPQPDEEKLSTVANAKNDQI